MKYLMIVGSHLADEPLENLDGRTPLEAAKTPNLDALVKKGELGCAEFAPHSLPAAPDVAAMAYLGFDPTEFYTGVAPLEALAAGIPQNDCDVVFRCDFVTLSDDKITDEQAGRISPKESGILLGELNRRFSGAAMKFFPGEGFRNFLILSDPERVDDLDDLDCVPPGSLKGKKASRHGPKGKGSEILADLIEKSSRFLQEHEINRVRVDLGENPASAIWLWGQGKRPKFPGFKQRYGVSGAVFSQADFGRGLAKALGMSVLDSGRARTDADFVFIYAKPSGEALRRWDLKEKIRWIEEFDAQIVGEACKRYAQGSEARVAVGADLTRRAHGFAPFVISGSGLAPSPGRGGGFDEKTALQSKLRLEKGYKLMGKFL